MPLQGRELQTLWANGVWKLSEVVNLTLCSPIGCVLENTVPLSQGECRNWKSFPQMPGMKPGKTTPFLPP